MIAASWGGEVLLVASSGPAGGVVFSPFPICLLVAAELRPMPRQTSDQGVAGTQEGMLGK